ncbi:ABC transporter ATP-binding protein [Cytobacillus sp. IB215665]|uniref:ABC transporter ATP-binding protein n=1 Tax=Cytobacillus sp. IB215665 TaxID=3097357 RepID=UPI002A130485|nr:ABC transporter ATP-binding protein [Cytobacillus sp. IB215665]MDX8365446.1 ABC transporter ATP-binding protein [Cytobacillus sp. IB215665]
MNKQMEFDYTSLNWKNIFRSFSYWPRVFQLLWTTKKSYFLVILCLTLLKGLFPVFTLLATQELINSIAIGLDQGFKVIVTAFLVLIAVSLFDMILTIIYQYFDTLLQRLLSNRINRLILEKSVEMNLEDFESSLIQDELKRVQNESGSRPFQTLKTILGMISSIVTLLSTIMVIVVWKWWVALVLVLIPFLSFISFLRLGQEEFLRRWKRAEKNRKSWYFSYLITNDKSAKEVRIYNLGSILLKRYNKIIEHFYQEDRLLLIKRIKISTIFRLITMVINYSIVLLVLWSAYLKEILVGNVVGLIQAIRLTESTAQGVVESIISLCQNNLYLEQLFNFLDMPITEHQFRMDNQVINHSKGNDSSLLKEKLAIPLSTVEKIEFKNVSFKYKGSDFYALKEVTFSVSKGETLAIVGKNGSGKSTLVKLLTQLYTDFEGEILINGISIRQYNKDILQRHFGVVFQDFVQYELPVRENIGFGDLDKVMDNENIEKAADRAGIENLIKQLPNGIDTQLGKWFSEGQQLSGGQWQRIAIARAFIRNADLYIMDEPSSFLDPLAEKEVFKKFQELVFNRIGLFITHRYSTVRFANHILLLDQGSVVEQGNHNELMNLGGRYAQLYDAQVSSFFDKEDSKKQVSIS